MAGERSCVSLALLSPLLFALASLSGRHGQGALWLHSDVWSSNCNASALQVLHRITHSVSSTRHTAHSYVVRPLPAAGLSILRISDANSVRGRAMRLFKLSFWLRLGMFGAEDVLYACCLSAKCTYVTGLDSNGPALMSRPVPLFVSNLPHFIPSPL